MHKFYFRFAGFAESAKRAIIQVYKLFMYSFAQFNSEIVPQNPICSDNIKF